MSTLDMREALYAIVEYAGPLDDPRIGWAGGINPPSQDEFLRCERCGREAIAATDIDHAEDCSAVKLLAVLRKVKEWVEDGQKHTITGVWVDEIQYQEEG